MAVVPPAGSDAPPAIARGVCHVLCAYDIGLAIDLDEAERRIHAQRETIKHRRRAPKYFAYRPAPLRVTQAAEALAVGPYRTASNVDLVLYDFGAVSATYALPLAGPLADLVVLSDTLYESAALLEDARRRVEQLAAALHPAVTKPVVADFVETYAIFHVEAFVAPCAPSELCAGHGALIAQILRSERDRLSADEVRDATMHRIAYGRDDVTIIDWDGAFVYGRDMDDVRAVLEFANVELLEMRHLDQRLDDALDEAYLALTRRARGLPLPGASRAELRRVGQLQVDGAVLFEGVNNALKLLGDQYLARLYRLVSERFHLAEWDTSILRKLDTLESIYQKMSDAAASWRLEILEWIIIILIAASIVIPFLPGGAAH